jgi:hypothetical protein
MELASLTSSISEFCQRISRGLSQATFDEMRQLVELLIDRVVVTMEEVEIRYVIPTSPTSEQIRFCHLLTGYFRPLSRTDERSSQHRVFFSEPSVTSPPARYKSYFFMTKIYW